MIEIEKLSDNKTEVRADNATFLLMHDDYTGDWIIGATGMEVQEPALETKSDAINFALYHAGVLEDPNYSHAPDRTSA